MPKRWKIERATLFSVVFIILVFSAVCMLGCSQPSANEDNVKIYVSDHGTPTKLDVEARDQVLSELKNYLVKYGDGWIYHDHNDNAYCQYKGLNAYISNNTTEADRLNGIEWRGTVVLQLVAPFRNNRWLSDNSWSEWYMNGTKKIIGQKDGFRADLIKRDDKWSIKNDFEINSLDPMSQ